MPCHIINDANKWFNEFITVLISYLMKLLQKKRFFVHIWSDGHIKLDSSYIINLLFLQQNKWELILKLKYKYCLLRTSLYQVFTINYNILFQILRCNCETSREDTICLQLQIRNLFQSMRVEVTFFQDMYDCKDNMMVINS